MEGDLIMLSRDKIRFINNELDIVVVSRQYFDLGNRRSSANANYMVKSIYNDQDSNPSMAIYEKTNTFYDYSTSRSGGPYEIIIQKENPKSLDELKEILKKFDLNISKLYFENNKVYSDLEEEVLKLYRNVLDYSYYNLSIMKNIEGVKFIESRSLDSSTVNKHKIGYIGNEDIYNKFGKYYSKEALQSSGLFYKLNNDYVFSYNNRLVIPYFDKNNNVVNFDMRSTLNTELMKSRNIPKYKNLSISPKLENIVKNKNFCINEEVRKNIFKKSEVIIVEGVFDMLRLSSHDIDNVAILRGVRNKDNIIAHLENVKDIYLLLDSDEPGIVASNDIIASLIMKNKLNIYMLELGDSEDVDEFFKHKTSEVVHDDVYTSPLVIWDFLKSMVLGYTKNNVMSIEDLINKTGNLINLAPKTLVKELDDSGEFNSLVSYIKNHALEHKPADLEYIKVFESNNYIFTKDSNHYLEMFFNNKFSWEFPYTKDVLVEMKSTIERYKTFENIEDDIIRKIKSSLSDYLVPHKRYIDIRRVSSLYKGGASFIHKKGKSTIIFRKESLKHRPKESYRVVIDYYNEMITFESRIFKGMNNNDPLKDKEFYILNFIEIPSYVQKDVNKLNDIKKEVMNCLDAIIKGMREEDEDTCK